jgi:predicted alpha/beta superfamily hydrolase
MDISIKSEYTNTEYPIEIFLPENFLPDKLYETVYCLDGESLFDTNPNSEKVLNASKELSLKYGKQDVIFIGIGGYDLRLRDFTLPTIPATAGEGGAENFANFIEHELIPKIENDFPVDTSAKSRVILGHSVGGSFASFLFAKHPEVFSNYLCLSPAFWYGDGVVLRCEEEDRAMNSSRKSIVFVGCGEYEDGIAILAEEFYLRLLKYYPNCITDFKKLKNQSHGSSLYQNVNHGLELYFKNK